MLDLSPSRKSCLSSFAAPSNHHDSASRLRVEIEKIILHVNGPQVRSNPKFLMYGRIGATKFGSSPTVLARSGEGPESAHPRRYRAFRPRPVYNLICRP